MASECVYVSKEKANTRECKSNLFEETGLSFLTVESEKVHFCNTVSHVGSTTFPTSYEALL